MVDKVFIIRDKNNLKFLFCCATKEIAEDYLKFYKEEFPNDDMYIQEELIMTC